VFRRYYNLTKPGIIRGNLLNATGGFLLASTYRIDLLLLLATLGGTALVIACGCVLNNIIDREVDAKMKRTKDRALVKGDISVKNALLYATFLGLAGFVILLVFTNVLTASIGLVALFMYVVVYGYFKRRSPLGTLVGTIPGALPPVAGYTAATGHLDKAAWLIFIILAAWQMAHFYSIAMYRQKDYKNAGIPVMPVVHGIARTKLSVMGYIIAFIAATTLLTVFGYTGYIYLTVMLGLGLAWLILGLRNYNSMDAVKWGKSMFLFSLTVILSLAVMLSVGARLA
jgi:protoheme IX farnesyltransferase